jgi:hypothetical protein
MSKQCVNTYVTRVHRVSLSENRVSSYKVSVGTNLMIFPPAVETYARLYNDCFFKLKFFPNQFVAFFAQYNYTDQSRAIQSQFCTIY